MSKSAFSFLVLALMAIATDMLLPAHAETLSAITEICVGVFATLFVLALVLGGKN